MVKAMKRITIIKICLLLVLLNISTITKATTYNPDVYQAQKRLIELGYSPGRPDGIWGKATQSAVAGFQRDMELPVTGRLDESTKARLGIKQLQRAIRVNAKTPSGATEEIQLYSGSYALLIGVSDYTAGWPDLGSVTVELSQVEEVIKTQGFQVEKHLNPNSVKLRAIFGTFIMKYGFDEGNRLLFYYSGHGHTRKSGSKGCLVPVDAPNPDKDEKGFLRKALPMNQILAWSRQIEAKHALFLFDSCFSGTVFKTKNLPKKPQHITRATALPVRQYITAGDAGETVPAKSVFTPVFLDALKYRWGDLNGDGYVSGTELGLYVQEQVPKHSKQSPQYGKIMDYELSRGDFIFYHITPLKPITRASVMQPKPLLQSKIKDYDKVIQKRKNEKEKWAEWQESMKRDFVKVQEYQKRSELSPKEKIKIWESFLSLYKDENPYTKKDNELRTRAEKEQKIQEYLYKKPSELISIYQQVIEEGDHNEVLNLMRLGMDAMQLGYQNHAEKAFDGVLTGIERVYADNEQATKARSTWIEEGHKYFIGEPYERVMTYYYRGLLYILNGNYQNARACFKGGMLQDSFAEEEQYRCDFALLLYLSGWCSQKINDTILSKSTFKELQKMRHDVRMPKEVENLLLVIETGRAPIKISNGVGNKLKFQRGHNFSEKRVRIHIDGNYYGMAHPIEDIFLQATTRGGRQFDFIIDHRGKADTRYWDNLPDAVHVATYKLKPGHHQLELEFLNKNNKNLTDLSKIIDINMPRKGFKLLWTRSREQIHSKYYSNPTPKRRNLILK